MMRALAMAACTLGVAVMADLAVAGGAGAGEVGSSPNIVLEKLYDQQDQALTNQDVDKFLSFVDPDSYTFIDEKERRFSFAEYQDALRKILARQRNINHMSKIKDVQVQNSKMVAYVEDNSQFEMNDDKSNWIPVNSTMTTEDTWELKGGEWKIVLTRTLRSRQTVDETWLAAKRKADQQMIDAARSAIYQCNFSPNGCR